MLNRKATEPLVIHTFIVTVEMVNEGDVEKIAQRLGDSLAWVEDIGAVDVQDQGKLEEDHNDNKEGQEGCEG